MKAILVLEDGTVFHGTQFGAEGETCGGVIFNTQVVGFQEIITDPANANKIIAIGYPHVGNVGVNDESNESDKGHAAALIVKEYSKLYSNWQAKGSFGDFMKKNKVIGIEGVDTQALTVHIRDNGEMRGVVSTKTFDVAALVSKAKAYCEPEALKSPVSAPKADKSQTYAKPQISNVKTVIINLGVNNSTLAKYPNAAIVSADTNAADILKMKPDQVVISSGPGDPTKLTDLVDQVKKLIGKVPIYGIQNGACVLALALNCTVNRMKVGHHGANQPVVDPKTGSGEISVQNHSFGIEYVPENVEVLHVNLNDKTIEKFATKDGMYVGTLYFPIDERGKLDKGYQYV
ncbi:MAG: carbamoyl phosphate synthase small subunit [Candidatus Saganbacteria bacterium]|nr:carbamoyl phosphate synthase small subunit [Candidatus Saganbacteria bacterium]